MALAPLNAEPSLPTEREKHHLSPKSYAAAAGEQPVLKKQKNPEQYIGQGEDNAVRSLRKKTHKKGSSRMNGYQSLHHTNTIGLVVEDFQDKERENVTTLKRNDTIELVSGRKAGAGWERSK